jgi:hypothetical protein
MTDLNKLIDKSLGVFKDTFLWAFALEIMISIFPLVIAFLVVLPISLLVDDESLSEAMITVLTVMLITPVIVGLMVSQWLLVQFSINKYEINFSNIKNETIPRIWPFLLITTLICVYALLAMLPGGLLYSLLDESQEWLQILSIGLMGVPVLYLLHRVMYAIVPLMRLEAGVLDSINKSIELTRSSKLTKWVFLLLVMFTITQIFIEYMLESIFQLEGIVPNLINFLVGFLSYYCMIILINNTYLFCSDIESKLNMEPINNDSN